MNTLLDNIFWHALTGPHAPYASGSQGARRYAPGFSPIVAVGEPLYCADWSGAVPSGLRLEAEATMFRKVWDGALREVSGVCTHPDYQGRGLARRLMLQLIRRQRQRGETPFLHVMRANAGAHALYLRMGFRDHLETPVRVIARC